jgi:hypothetical protein
MSDWCEICEHLKVSIEWRTKGWDGSERNSLAFVTSVHCTYTTTLGMTDDRRYSLIA